MSRFSAKKKLEITGNLIPLQNNSLLPNLLHIWHWVKQQVAFTICVLVPLLLITVYLTLIKTPEYESKANILIHNYEDTNSFLNGANQLFHQARQKQQSQVPPSATVSLIKRYLHSEELLAALQTSTDVKNHYQSTAIDRISRLKKNSNQKEFLNYFIKKLTFSFDSKTGELIIVLKAFSPDKAQELLNLIVNQTIGFLSHVEQATAQAQSHFLQTKLDDARKKLTHAELAFKQLSQQAKKSGLQKEIELKKLELKFSRTEYEAAQQAYVFWIMSLKKNSLVKTALPNLPDYYAYPQIPYDLFRLLVIFTVLFILAKIIFIVIREHLD